MAANRTIELAEEPFELLVRESERRGVAPGALASQLLQANLAGATEDLDRALGGLAALREHLPSIDGLALARAARSELDQRAA